MQAVKRTFGFIFSHPIAGRRLLQSFARLITWQIQCRVFPANLYVKPFIGNTKFYAGKRMTGITGNIYTGLHEFADMGFLLHFLRPEDCFYDIGANVGAYTLLASGVCGAQTIALEPGQQAFVLLQKNIELNQLSSRVRLLKAGAGAKKDEVLFSVAEDTTNHVITENERIAGTTSEQVSILPVDDLFDENYVSLMKIDVEGYETEVLSGMQKTLQAPALKAIIIELNGSGTRYGYIEKNIHDLLTANGFSAFIYDPFSRSLTPSAATGNYNTLFCRNEDMVRQRLKHATVVKVMGETF